MAEIDDISTNSEPPTKEYLWNALNYGLSSNVKISQSTQSTYYATSDLRQLVRNKGKIAQYVVNFAYKNKDRIKRIPYFGKFALSMKRKLLKQLVPLQKMNIRTLELSGILTLGVLDFITQLYLLALGREPDVEAVEKIKVALCSGATKEAIIYQVVTSQEFANRARIVNIRTFRYHFWKFHLFKVFISLPIIGWFMSFILAPHRINQTLIEARLHHLDQTSQNQRQNEAVNSHLNELQSSIDSIPFELLSSRLDDLQSRLESLPFEVLTSDLDDLKLRIESMPIEGLSSKVNDLDLDLNAIPFETLSSRLNDLQSRIELLSSNFALQSKHAVYGLPGGVTVIQMKDYIFGVPSEEWRLAIFLEKYGFFEPGTEKYFRSIISPGMIIVDVGANLGIYTLHGLAAGCEVYSYEPTPRIFKIMKDNVGINGFEPTNRAHLFELAVSDRSGKVEFTDYKALSGHNTFYGKSSEGDLITVDAVSLDEHIGHLDHVDVVKIDVEGAEALVLTGMRDIISNNPNIKIVMEFSPGNLLSGGFNPSDVLRLIESMGLEYKLIDEQSGELKSISEQDLCNAYSDNILLTRFR